jgi:hypothetical protein
VNKRIVPMVAQYRQSLCSQGVGGEKQGENEVKNMEPQTLISILSPFITIFFTIFFAFIIATYKKLLRNKLAYPKLKIQCQNIEGELAHIAVQNYGKIEEKKVIFYHLKVKNEKTYMVKNCRVYLDKIVDKKDNKEIKINALYPFCWSPSEITQIGVDFWHEYSFDIGFLVEGEEYFRLGLRTDRSLINYIQEKYSIKKDGNVILSLKVTADNFPEDHTQYFEIKWDGEWPEDPEKKHLTIEDITLTYKLPQTQQQR